MSEDIDINSLKMLVEEYRKAKEFATKVATRADELKSELTKMVKAHGKPDDKGNLWLAAGDNQVKHERRVSRNLDRQAAERWARSHGLWDEVKEIVEVLSEDALLRHFWENPDKKDILEDLYANRETWAFKIVEKKSYDDEDE